MATSAEDLASPLLARLTGEEVDPTLNLAAKKLGITPAHLRPPLLRSNQPTSPRDRG